MNRDEEPLLIVSVLCAIEDREDPKAHLCVTNKGLRWFILFENTIFATVITRVEQRIQKFFIQSDLIETWMRHVLQARRGF